MPPFGARRHAAASALPVPGRNVTAPAQCVAGGSERSMHDFTEVGGMPCKYAARVAGGLARFVPLAPAYAIGNYGR